jgi:excisionase family DNA binding protein
VQAEQSAALFVADVAQTLGVTREHIYYLVQRGEIRSDRLGRRIVIPRTVVDDLLQGRGRR